MQLCRSMSAVLIWVTSLACSPAWAALPSLDEIGRTAPGLRSAGWGGFAVADFDGDGHEDIAVPGINGSGQIQIFGQTPDGIQVKQVLILEDIESPTLQAVVHDGTVTLYGLSGPILTEYSGWPLARVRSLHLMGLAGLPGMAIGDIDADGTDDIVAVNSSNEHFVRTFNLSTGAITWSIPNDQGTNVTLAQLDADPALEIIVDGFGLRVIDGATKAVEWIHGENLVCCLTKGRFANAADDAFAASGGTEINPLNVYRSNPYSIAWSQPLYQVGVLGGADLDHDGIDELLEGDLFWGSLRVFDGRTGNERLVVPHSAHGIAAVAAVQFSGIGAPSIVFSSRIQYYQYHEVLRVVDSTNGMTQWEMLNDRGGSYGLVAMGDVNEDGRKELLLASGADYATKLSITQIDATTGAEQWRTPMHPPASTDFPYSFVPVFIGIAHRNGLPPTFVSGGTTGSGGRLVAVEGPDHTVIWDLRNYDGGILTDILVQQGKVYDFDSDGNDEIVVCTREAGSSIAAFGVAVFDGRSGAMLWRTTGLGSNMDLFCNGVMAGIFDDGQAPRIVALLAGSVEAIDAATHNVVWSLPLADASGAWLIESGQSGREFAVAQAGIVRFYDASSMNFLRQISAPEPVLAIREVDSNIHRLLVTSDGRLRVVDGINGNVSATSDYLGPRLGNRDHLVVWPQGGGSHLVGVGSDAGAFRLHLRITEVIHADGFD